MVAAYFGLNTVAERLLNACDTYIESQDATYGRSALSWGAGNGVDSTVYLLLDAGSRVNSKDKIGGTPVSYAACNGHNIVIDLFAKAGVAVDLEKILLSALINGDETAAIHLVKKVCSPLRGML